MGADFSEAMLERARAKAPRRPPLRMGRRAGLPYASGSFDAATVGFGARNFSELDRGVAEMARVVRPGGRVVILEITTPQRPPLSWFYSALVRSSGAGAGAPGRRPRRLQLPAQLGQALPRPAGAGRRDERRRAGRTCAGCSPPAGSSPSTTARWVDEHRGSRTGGGGGGRGPPGVRGLMEALGAPAAGAGQRPRRAAGPPRRGHDRRRRQATASPDRVRGRGRGGRQRGPGARGGGGGAGALGHPGARRRARRRRPAPRPAHGGGQRRARAGHRHRRPAVLARLRRAGGQPRPRPAARAVGCLQRAGSG